MKAVLFNFRVGLTTCGISPPGPIRVSGGGGWTTKTNHNCTHPVVVKRGRVRHFKKPVPTLGNTEIIKFVSFRTICEVA